MENKSKDETRYDWSKASDWANYIVTDCNNDIYEFECRPTLFAQIIWKNPVGRRNFLGKSENFEDYRNSLEERPNHIKTDVVCKCCGVKQKLWNIIDNWYIINGKEYCPPCYRKIRTNETY